ncbi:Uncharacterised protein [Vibrio cholerae]|nr:Uncharacterised protein [Vibrio cholerae]CSI83128.1 Uncharacterised protein [Vibrio cholerae]
MVPTVTPMITVNTNAARPIFTETGSALAISSFTV